MLTVLLLWSPELRGEDILMERIVAIVENEPVFYSELIDHSIRLQRIGEWTTWQEALSRLIDRKLITIEARRLRLDAELQNSSPDALVQSYIDLVGRARPPRSRVRAAMRTMIQDARDGGEARNEVAGGEATERQQVTKPGSVEQIKELAIQLRQRYDIRILMDENPSEGSVGR